MLSKLIPNIECCIAHQENILLIPENKQSDVENAEKYLMNVFKNMSKAETLNELRT